MAKVPEFEEFASGKEKICVVGLGYVGLPLAVLLGKRFKVVGYDINESRIRELKNFHDRTGEVSPEEIKSSNVEFTTDEREISNCKLVIVTVPTPIDSHKIPDLNPVKSATKTVGRNLKEGTVVVYESTVYPGVTEEICVPILERESSLKWKEDFFVGYSPERVNPGDKEHTIDRIVKVVSGDLPETAELLEEVYGSVIKAGVHRAPNIKTAEAAKVIENTQRDLNIALMNELAVIFHKLGIDTRDVLEAAGTKWNFLKFEP
jgi:UDP-N-acetyl-D-galactosamine dehydrogenase